MITVEDCKKAWNEQADEFNQWDALDADERCEWCIKMASAEKDTCARARWNQQ